MSPSDVASSGHRFDVHHLYHNAVNSLVSCDRTIKCLREELTSKDERIVMLEERLVQMSLELASTKASEDVLQHRLSKQQKLTIAACRIEESKNFSAANQRRENEQEVPTIIVNTLPSSTAGYNPVLKNSKRRSPSQSWSKRCNGSTPMMVESRHLAPKRRGGFRLLPLAMNWPNNSNDSPSFSSATTSDILGHSESEDSLELIRRIAIIRELDGIHSTKTRAAPPLERRTELE